MLLLLATFVGVAWAATFPSKCPLSSKDSIGCYCTYGCSVNGDPTYPWVPASWPPPLIPAETMGSDTICAKVTIPLAFQMTQSTSLAKFLGARSATNPNYVTTAIPDQTELTIYTSFTQKECADFMVLASQLVAVESQAKNLYIDLCTTESCNVVNDRPLPTSKEVAAYLPGTCTASSEKPMGCYCTNRCSINQDFVEFRWEPNAWPPRKETASYLGADTICATVTLPILDSAAARSLAEFVGISGNVSMTNQNYAGPPVGSEVTVYTALTASECAEFQRRATALIAETPDAAKLLVFICTKPWCNTVGAISVARDITLYLIAVVLFLLLVAGLLLWRQCGAKPKPVEATTKPTPAPEVSNGPAPKTL